MSKPVAGELPSLTTASEKYSILSDWLRGEGGACPVENPSPMISFGDLVDLSDPVRTLAVDRPLGDFGTPEMLKSGEIE